jgi:hypothetical protein
VAQIISLELNELNFDVVEKYAATGDLPTFRRVFDRHDVHVTRAEKEFNNLEPWIQWVSVHTGLRFDEHKIFRLGDVVDTNVRQIWDVLEEEHGLKVGAISPMNARNNLKNAAFFVPDPWTKTPASGSQDLIALSEGLNQAVNDNAHGVITPLSYLKLLFGAALNAFPGNYSRYAMLAKAARSGVWRKALFLDLLLADVFIRHSKRKKPDFASLFLNAAAHIQHHYTYSSKHYSGDQRNPSWYVSSKCDPVEECYKVYDRILDRVLTALPDARVLITTGLSQLPNPRLVHYYRPRDHQAFLNALGVKSLVDVQPRMSRDFLLVFKSAQDAGDAADLLNSFRAADGDAIFRVENRGETLFCMLMYTKLIGDRFTVVGNGKRLDNFDQWVLLVSIENAIHRTEGFFVDCGEPKSGRPSVIPVESLFHRTIDVCTGKGARRPAAAFPSDNVLVPVAG